MTTSNTDSKESQQKGNRLEVHIFVNDGREVKLVLIDNVCQCMILMPDIAVAMSLWGKHHLKLI